MPTSWQIVTYRELKAEKAGHPTKRDQVAEMRDDQSSEEEKLMKELDRMYLHVADLESGQITAQNNPDEPDQNSGHRAANHEKVIPFPVRRSREISGEPSEDRLR